MAECIYNAYALVGAKSDQPYDFKGQLLGVKEGEEHVERYVYDRAGNMLRKTVGGKTTTFVFDDANQLVSSTTDGITTRYEYDAAGRLVREGDRTYTYGYLDKVTSVRDGANKFTYTYHPDGWNQLAYCGNWVTGAVDLWGCVNLNLFASGTMQWTVANYYDEVGFFTVGAYGPSIHDASGGNLSVVDLVTKIMAAGWNGIDSIKLLSCKTAVGAAVYCQDLANELGVSVLQLPHLFGISPREECGIIIYGPLQMKTMFHS